MDLSFNNIVGLIITGLLGILWLDIRSIRKEGIKYLTKERHEIICKGVMTSVALELEKAKQEIIKEIRNNGRK